MSWLQASLPTTAGKDLADASASPSRAADVAGLFEEKDQLLTAHSSYPRQTEQAKTLSQPRERSNLNQQKDCRRSPFSQKEAAKTRVSWMLGWVISQLWICPRLALCSLMAPGTTARPSPSLRTEPPLPMPSESQAVDELGKQQQRFSSLLCCCLEGCLWSSAQSGGNEVKDRSTETALAVSKGGKLNETEVTLTHRGKLLDSADVYFPQQPSKVTVPTNRLMTASSTKKTHSS